MFAFVNSLIPKVIAEKRDAMRDQLVLAFPMSVDVLDGGSAPMSIIGSGESRGQELNVVKATSVIPVDEY